MKLSQLIDELTRIFAANGDMAVTISIAKRPTDPTDQSYLISEPTIVIFEGFEEGNEVSIRDWPY